MRLLLFLLLLGFALPGVSATIPDSNDDTQVAPSPRTPRPAADAVPSLGAATINNLLNTPVPEMMEFCGESVPLERPDVAERLDLVTDAGSPALTRYQRVVVEVDDPLANPGFTLNADGAVEIPPMTAHFTLDGGNGS